MRIHFTTGLAVAFGMLLASGATASAQGKKQQGTRPPAPRTGGQPAGKGQPRNTQPPRPGVGGQPKSGVKLPPKTGGGVPPKTIPGSRPKFTPKPPVGVGKKRPPVGTVPGKGRSNPGGKTPIGVGTKRPPVGTLPGLGKRPVGTRPGIVVGGRQPRLPATGQSRIAAIRQRNLALNQRLRLAGAGGRAVPYRARRDWQVWNGDYYRRYGFIRGYWGSPWLSRWDLYWGRRWQRRFPLALAFGTSWWGLNRLGYRFGYFDYYNPYAGEPIALGGGVMCDYAQPLVQPPADGDPNAGGQPQESQMFALARKAFLEGNYRLALADVNGALKDAPQDAAMHEFRGLVLFAMGDYKAAAAPLNGVLAVGPGWDWKTIRGLYPDGGTYTKHLRALEKSVIDNPKDAAGHFVLGYHYVAMGHASHALKQFQQAADLAPRDAVARQMATMLSKGNAKDDPREADDEPPLAGGAAGGAAAGTAGVTLEKLTGNWSATRGKESFKLAMTKEDRFTWTHVDADGKKTEIKGVYALQKGNLALEVDAGGVLLASVSFTGEKQMNFRMINDNDKDPGLTFTR